VKGCAIAGLRSLLALLLIAGSIGAALIYGYGEPPASAIGVALAAGVLGWIAANLLLSALRAWRERAGLHASLAGTPPVDGRPAIIAGHIEPAGAPLRAPFSGRDCVAYRFEIYEIRSGGKSHHKVVYADGIAVVPSMIVTAAGSYRLLAVPELDCDETSLDHRDAAKRAAAHTRTLPYTPPPEGFSRPAIEQQWSDADGDYRRERRYIEGDVDLTNWKLSEKMLERGARVCVFGHYSASQRAIVSDPNDWSKITRVMKGDADAVVSQLGASVRRRLIGAVVIGGAAAAVVSLYVSRV
jgi:hypothetical protein